MASAGHGISRFVLTRHEAVAACDGLIVKRRTMGLVDYEARTMTRLLGELYPNVARREWAQQAIVPGPRGGESRFAVQPYDRHTAVGISQAWSVEDQERTGSDGGPCILAIYDDPDIAEAVQDALTEFANQS